MSESHRSIHVLGSRQFGGADQFYVRLVRALNEAGERVLAVNRKGSPVAQALGAEGIDQLHVPLANGWDLWSVWLLRNLVARHDPCVVQTYMGRATRLTRLPRNSGAVHVARLGGYYKIDGYYRHCHAWIGNTRGICDYLVRSGLPVDRVHQIGNFVPDAIRPAREELEQLRQTWNIPDDAWVVFALGRLIEVKGFEDLLRAVADMPRQIGGRPVVVLIAGDGSMATDLKSLAESLGLEDRIRWLGWQNRPDPYYALADLFVCPSRHEPLGNVILEAWNHGLPVVSTSTAGATELIEDGRSGMLCPVKDPGALAALIQSVLQASEQDRLGLGRQGQTYLQDHFSREAILGAYLELYGNLLSSR